MTAPAADDGDQQLSLAEWLLGEILAFAEPLRQAGYSEATAAAL